MFTTKAGGRWYKYEFLHTVEESAYDSYKDRVTMKANTTCYIYARSSGKYDQVATGQCRYNNKKDQFSFSMGRKYALADALEKLNLSKQARTDFWKDYLCQMNGVITLHENEVVNA